MRTVKSFLLILLFFLPLKAQDRHEWTLDENYSGAYPQTFQKLKWQVPILMRQTMINLSVKLGMNYQEGWQYPIQIRFLDGAPGGAENILAFVQIGTTGDGQFVQQLGINLAAYEKEEFNFEKTFAHELVHAMLNDAIGGEAAVVFPVWLHEGLAVYGAGQGEAVVKAYTYQFSGYAEGKLINGLEGPHGALDYAEDYLALKYMYEKHGPNSLHNFVREVIYRKGDVPGAIQYTCFESWDKFQENARLFAKEEIRRLGFAKRGQYEKPY